MSDPDCDDAQLLRVVLAEDNTLLREGLQMLLERNGFVTVAAVGSAHELLTACGRHDPDLVITDVRMPPDFRSEGLAAASELRQKNPRLPIVVLSQYIEQSYVAELLDGAGNAGIGYLLKDRVSDVREFADTLRRVQSGGTAIDPAVITQMIGRRRDPLEQLTPRERDVLGVVAEGHSNAAIARMLFISEAAVVKHIGNIMMKLGIPPNNDQNRRVAAVLAYLRVQGRD
ncbi:response regulator transcription factor [Rhodococcus sp. BGS-1C]|jgi:DNA-binding NarL/FixJ family response regulator|uniref:response regulator transcription factor n=1 Tax=unclassified Rhodococcus (in: high G+C Gram-positive bacteria) TaxID=192944 RepID=UPI0019D1E9AE|nr:response regulator transcription factor [Rhodococcus sp. KRD197]